MTETRSELKTPKVAWPTVLLGLACLSAFSLGSVLIAHGVVVIGMLLSLVACYCAFTPLHDGVHRSVAGNHWLNDLVGRAVGFLLGAELVTFRWVHLEHHKHTNEPDHDPDFWSGRGPWYVLPLRWLTQDLYYLYLHVRRGRPRHERVLLIAHYAVLAMMIAAAISAGHGAVVVLGWVLPSRLAIALLAFGFDYLPHRPHVVEQQHNRFLATSVRPSSLLGVLLLNQNYHLIHHLHPGVPFYRYARIWEQKREYLIAQGAKAA